MAALMSARAAAMVEAGVPRAIALQCSVEFDEDDPGHAVICALVLAVDALEGEGAVLVFVPGWDDISKVHSALLSSPVSSRLDLHALHGAVPSAQQRAVFNRPPPGRRKVIVATNIAESSITIDDVAFVIDSGKHKEKTYDAHAKISCLLPAWVSSASAHQRRGRAGRVRAGKCWHLYPQWKQDELQPYSLPEMLRTPLGQCCLSVRSLGVAPLRRGGIEAFLTRALTPPSPRALANALSSLRRLGALDPETEALTPVGRCLSSLPMESSIPLPPT